jgi:rfaE bifunctional protein kinase chain/domain
MNSVKNKITKLVSISETTDEKVVLCHGHFNIIHPGHIRYLDFASKQGTKLVVSVKGDSYFKNLAGNNHFSEEVRASGVALIQIVDQVVIIDKDYLGELIKKLNPDTLVLGKEFESEQRHQVVKEIRLLKKQGGKVFFHSGETHYADSNLLRDNLNYLEEQRRESFIKSMAQQNINVKELFECIENFKDASLLVIGDTIVDQYVACDALGMSAEAPVIVIRELDSKNFVGGAAIVAMHSQCLGANCHYLSVVGKDENAAFVKKELSSLNIEHVLVEDDSRPTTFKTRYMVDNQKIFRVSRMKEHSLTIPVENIIIEEIKRVAPNVDGILVSDFVYGVITPKILETISKIANEYNILVFGDIQCSSQIGNVSKFKNFELICPTEREARVAIGTQDEGVEWVANTLMSQTNSRNMVMKLGGEGFIAYGTETDGSVNRQYFPALSINPVDVSGAGDSLLAALSVGLCSGATLMQASAIGASMASLAVQNIGNTPISSHQLRKKLLNLTL